uniref:Uncharacterized protein n=1 Tax=Lepeophtheirus salmonis TaxID=72036 RepID=A0A0K2SVG4_LEPSM
MSDINLERVD